MFVFVLLDMLRTIEVDMEVSPSSSRPLLSGDLRGQGMYV